MTAIHVTTQAELNAALNNPKITYAEHEIIICNTDGKWITIEGDHGKDIRACDSATVRASGSATVRAWGSATVRAWDSATVEAWGSATVRACDSATVEASGSATVRASGLYVVTRRLSTSATVTGGTILDLTTLDQTRIDSWAAYHGAQTDDGMLTLYKAVPADGTTGKRYGHPVEWPTGGGIVECDDWDPEPYCGGGLHLSPTPWQARQYLDGGDQRGARFLECRAPAAEVIPLRDDKAKARSVVVVREVDVDGDPVAGGEAR